MLSATYRTVKGYGEARTEIEKSLFICYAARAETEAEAQAFVAQIRKKHADATHNCAAYLVGEAPGLQKADDDGEPSGTAGRPMLEIIKKTGLRDTVLVVTRYFGGIKLGAGGLIRAYGKSASTGLKAAGIVERNLHRQLAIMIDYPLLGNVENQLKVHQYTISAKEFAQQITLNVLEPEGENRLTQQVADWTSGLARVVPAGEIYVDTVIED
ncbi:MAG TPA: YigZ family protein [Patescibacteria group bacterium]|nr:YigZ family protein [Patescibacteria group bacterium]